MWKVGNDPPHAEHGHRRHGCRDFMPVDGAGQENVPRTCKGRDGEGPSTAPDGGIDLSIYKQPFGESW